MPSRRRFLKIAASSFAITCLGAGVGLAQTLEDRVEKALRRQGYSNISTSRTFLGRLRVTAKKGRKSREVILNRTTGEVLRDVILDNGRSRSIFGGGKQNDRSSNGASDSVDDDSDDDENDSHDDSHDEDGDE